MRCIYRIDINDRYYIGSTNDFDNRKRLHLIKLRKQYHPNKFLQNLFNKYGESSFIFSVVENIAENIDTLEVEQIYLDTHFGQENCVNLTPIAGGGFYYIRTPEIIQKQLDSRRTNGNWYNAANYNPKEAIAANTGSKRSKEVKDKLSKIKKDMYKNNPKKLDDFKNSAATGRARRWQEYNKPFILKKNGEILGPFNNQRDVYETGIMSGVSISQLFLGKKNKVKGYILEFIDNTTTK